MQIDKNNIKEDKSTKLVAQGIHEMSAKYSKHVDEQVCKFLENRRIQRRQN